MQADFCEERFTGRLTRLRSCSHTAGSGLRLQKSITLLHKRGSLKADGLQASKSHQKGYLVPHTCSVCLPCTYCTFALHGLLLCLACSARLLCMHCVLVRMYKPCMHCDFVLHAVWIKPHQKGGLASFEGCQVCSIAHQHALAHQAQAVAEGGTLLQASRPPHSTLLHLLELELTMGHWQHPMKLWLHAITKCLTA